MKVTILNGASGVGKTAVLHHILHRLPARSGILDGDDVARLHPFECSAQWLNLVQENLFACARNLRGAGLRHLLLAFVFPSQERIDRLNGIFGANGFSLTWLHLVADEAHLEERLRQRGVTKREIVENSLGFNKQIADLATQNSFPCIDSSSLTLDELCDRVLETIESSDQGTEATAP